MKILIIEDEDFIYQLLKAFFNNFGYECNKIKPIDLESTLDIMRKGYDVILCDYMMPGITGWDIFQAIDDELKRKFIITTGGYIDCDKEKQLKASNVKIIYKPFNMEYLHSLIKEIYEGK